jgi:phenylacetate-CoA ligase
MDLCSSIDPIVWPAVLSGPGAQLMALEFQLEGSQWWSADQLLAQQLRQLKRLVEHAARQVPHYTDTLREAGVALGEDFTLESWRRIPVLTRRDVEALGDRLRALEVPKSLGQTTMATSGGSSGIPVRVLKTELDSLLWASIHVREELWHRDGERGVLARIRRVPPQLSAEQAAEVRSPRGLMLPDWGAPVARLWRTGRMGVLDDRVSIPEQAEFLKRLQPEYLHVFPANLRLLLAHFRDDGVPLRSLRSVWTMSEVVDDSLRAACRQIFGCRIVHNYASAEAGYMALQCPEHEELFHVQSEVVLIEVLDTDNRPCGPGQVGRVVVTPLHNFATPLLRYEIGDEAEVGEACACGRGLPVIRRIVGRSNDYLVTRDGRRQRVEAGYYRLCAIAAIREFQIIQRSLEEIELVVVLGRPLSPEETAEIQRMLAGDFGQEFRFVISVRDAIARTESGKLKAFVSALAPSEVPQS